MHFDKCHLIVTILCLCHAAKGATILALFSSLSFADHYTYRGYVELLARNGHSVIVMTPYPGHFQYPEVEKIVELDVSQVSAPFWTDYKKYMSNMDDNLPNLRKLNELAVKVAIAQLRSQQMTALFINPNVMFDLVITEADMPILYAAADKYGAPHIAITTGSGTVTMYESKGSPTHPLFYPHTYTLNFGNLGFWQKISEFGRYLRIKYEYYYYYLPLCQIAAEKIFGLNRDLLSVEQDIDLLFISASQALLGNRPTAPAVVFTNGLHIKPGLALPQELKAILDSSGKGCVYFSLGTVQESEDLSKTTIQTFLDAFGELPYTVFWKIGNVTNFRKPDNVITQAWFPQQEILAHPNMKAFITNGGDRSLEEAVSYGVPIVGLPIVTSRKVFIAEITKRGAGEILDPNHLDKETIKKTVTEVATNDTYKKSMVNLGEIIHHPLSSGPQQAVWWTEYLLRHGGAHHLHSPAYEVSSCEYFSLEVFCVFFVIALLLLWANYKFILYVIVRLRRKFSRKQTGGKFKAL